MSDKIKKQDISYAVKLSNTSMLLVVSLFLLLSAQGIMGSEKPRIVILSDIGGDPDDQQALTRLLCYANEFNIEGLIASSNLGHGEATRKDLIVQIINSYGGIYENIRKHADGYPTAGYLLECVKEGNPCFGVENIGEEHDTEGSNYIISLVDRPDSRLLNIAVWGGTTDLAQALWKVKNDRPEEELDRFIRKLRVHAIADQDSTGAWIRSNFPNLFYIRNGYNNSYNDTFRGMYRGGDTTTCQKTWVNQNIKNNHGSLGGEYPDSGIWAPPENCMKEGDTPSWFYFLNNGLNIPQSPDAGSWGGRFKEWTGNNNHWQDAIDSLDGDSAARVGVSRWRKVFNADFQARMDWCVNAEYAAVNHNPQAVVNGDTSKNVVRLTVPINTSLVLDATGSTDPDGNTLHFNWWQYKEAGTCISSVVIDGTENNIATIQIPDELGKTLHIILEVKDSGTPSLSSFRRIVITCGEAASTENVANIKTASERTYDLDTLEAGKKCYVDRAYTFTSTAGLDGLPYIRTANNDKSVTGDEVLSFTLKKASTIYIAYDSRSPLLPEWLVGWNSTGLYINTTDVERVLYSKEYEAGMVVLGENNADSMYNVIIQKISDEPVDNTPNDATNQILLEDDFFDNTIGGLWETIGDLPVYQENGDLCVDTRNTNSWRGGGVATIEKFSLESPVCIDCSIIIPDTSSNQYCEIALAPELDLDSEGQAHDAIRLSFRGSTVSVVQKKGDIQNTIWSVGQAFVSGTAISCSIVATPSEICVHMNGNLLYSGLHELTSISNGAYLILRAANKYDSTGGIMRFESIKVSVEE